MSIPRKREYVLMAVALSLAIFAAIGGDKPEDRVLEPIEPSALDCQRLVRGQWLYGALIHRGDKEPLRIECWYGYGAMRFAL